MNGYTTKCTVEIEYQSCLSTIHSGPASHKIERILKKEAGIKVYHSSENKLFPALCTHIRTAFLVNVVWFTLVKLVEISQYVLRNIRRIARKPSKIQ
jgi:hypothetical protein